MTDLVPSAAKAEDLAEVLRLVQSCGLPLEGIPEAFPRGYVVVRQGAALVGVAGLELYDDVGLLRSVAVTAHERGRGVGRALVAERLAAAKHQHLSAIYLLTLTAADYFRSLGFSDADRGSAPASLQRAPELAKLCPASAVCLALTL